MKNTLFTMVVLLFAVATTWAQPVGNSLPDNPDPNKCYVRCVTPDVYETEEVRVMVRPEYKRMKVVPAVYETKQEEVVIKEGYTRYEVIGAEFRTESVDYQSEQPYNKIALTAANFGEAFDSVMVSPKVARWEYTPYDGCQSDDPADCQVLCYREYPAQYAAVPKQVLSKAAGMTKSSLGGKNSAYTKQVISRAAEVREIPVEPEVRTITKRTLVSDERVEEETVEPEYTTVTREVLKQKGGLAVWEEIECELMSYNVLPINYELNSARLTTASRNIIDTRLLKLLKDSPNVRVEIGSHTDSRGSKENNQGLSERRAQSVVNYLIGKGVNSSRLVARGFGESRLKNRCADGVPCTEKEHAANRRTEFRILNTEM